MNSVLRKEAVIRFKSEAIKGISLSFIPYQKEHGTNIVRLRNMEKNRYFLNQSGHLTLEMQDSWYNKYALRDDDIYWCIFDKSDNFLGVIRLYEINHDGTCCTQGSFILDEELASQGPYALEAELLSLDFAFDILKIEKVINEDRQDNKNMNSISRRLGFNLVKETDINGTKYNYYELVKENYRREPLVKVLELWERNKEGQSQ